MIYLLAAFCILCHVLDVVTTNLALSKANTAEGNPVVAWLMSKLGRFWWAYKVPIVALIAYVGLSGFTAALVLALIHGGVYGYVLNNNWQIYRKMK